MNWYPLLFKTVDKSGQIVDNIYEAYQKGTYQRSEPEPLRDFYEFVDAEDCQSIVDNGAFSGLKLRELIERHPSEIVHEKYDPRNRLPLIVKYCHTTQQLPIYVHPAAGNSESPADAGPNTKAWFVVTARRSADVSVGISRFCTQQQFRRLLHSPDIKKLTQTFPSEFGDAYYIPPGRIHSLSAGNLILAFEQNNNRPLEVCHGPFDAPGATPTSKEHRSAVEFVHFHDRTLARIRVESSEVARNRKMPLISHCPFFGIDELRLVNECHEFTAGTGFHLLVPVVGKITIESENSVIKSLAAGRCCCLPAALGAYTIIPERDDSIVLKASLQIY